MRTKQIFLCAVLILTFGLNGCSVEKVDESRTWPADMVSSVKIASSSWQVKIMASTDEAIHLSLAGGSAGQEETPVADLSDGILNISQKTDGSQSRLAMGKRGQITLYLPSDDIPLYLNNDSGDMEISGIHATNLSLANQSGYVRFDGVTADRLNITSASGDISVSGSTVSAMDVVSSSGYLTIRQSVGDMTVTTKSGEVNLSGLAPDTDLNVQTGSGDVSISYETAPENLALNISSGSKDISVALSGISYTVNTEECRQGAIGNGEAALKLMSDSGTVVIQ